LHPLIEKAKREERPLLETEALSLLGHYGITVPEHHFAGTEKEVLEACRELGWPVVIKVVSPDILHKSDVAGVILNVKTKKQATQAFSQLISLEKGGHRIHGVLVYPFQSHDIELSAGMLRDEQFGPVITFGLGGIWIEVLQDVSFGIAPLSSDEAEEMISSIRGHALLEGKRGNKPVDREAIRDLLIRLSQMALQEEVIREMDLNPFFPLEKGVFIADARIIV
jgi:acetyl-CoA synthetase (ADP-forming)